MQSKCLIPCIISLVHMFYYLETAKLFFKVQHFLIPLANMKFLISHIFVNMGYVKLHFSHYNSFFSNIISQNNICISSLTHEYETLLGGLNDIKSDFILHVYVCLGLGGLPSAVQGILLACCLELEQGLLFQAELWATQCWESNMVPKCKFLSLNAIWFLNAQWPLGFFPGPILVFLNV